MRSQQTAAPFGLSRGLDVTTDHRLVERSWGDWEGMLPADIEARFPGWEDEGLRPSGFEDDRALWVRVAPFLRDLGDGQGHILVVTHGALMQAVVAAHGEPGEPFQNLEGQWLTIAETTVTVGDRESFL